MLSQVCALQKQYGKTQAELETLVEGFSWALADYQMPKIIKAMREYIKKNSDIPAPADIIKIILELDRQDRTDNLSVSTEKLLEYRKNGVPLTTAQKHRLEVEGYGK